MTAGARRRRYRGYTHPHLFAPGNWLWARVCCPRRWHLWDEVLSMGDPDRSGRHHYLFCDACGTTLELA